MYNDPTGHVVGSVVDFMNDHGMNSSYSARKEEAKDAGIKNYTGTAAQNTQLLQYEIQKAAAKTADDAYKNRTTAQAAIKKTTDSNSTSTPKPGTSTTKQSSQPQGNAVTNNPISVGLVKPLPPGTPVEVPNYPGAKPNPIGVPGAGVPKVLPIPWLIGITIAMDIVTTPIPTGNPEATASNNLEQAAKQLEKYKSIPNSNVQTDEDNRVLIYRKGNKTMANLTPRESDTTTGMSWQFTKPIGDNYIVTTIDEINRPNLGLVAMPDGPNHVSVRPSFDDTNSTYLKAWAATRPLVLFGGPQYDPNYEGHPLTQVLYNNPNLIPVRVK